MRRKHTGGTQADAYGEEMWHWAREIGAAYGGSARVALLATDRVGVWAIRAEYTGDGDPSRGGQLVTVQREWPGAQPQSLTGAIWQALMALDHAVARARGQKELPF